MRAVLGRLFQMLIGAVILIAAAFSQASVPLWAYLVTLLLLGFALTILLGYAAGSFAGLGMVACALAFTGYDAWRGALDARVLGTTTLLAMFVLCMSLGSLVAGLLRSRIVRQDAGKDK